MVYSADTKERIRQAVDILDLATAYGMTLHHSGKQIKALCPWHPDTNPSLQFNPVRQTYKCWVCGEGGDLFSMVMKLEGVGFPEALKMLAERAGVPLEHVPASKPEQRDVKNELYRAMDWAVNCFQRAFQSTEGENARNYLLQRGLQPETLKKFRVGFAPDAWDWLISQARTHGLKLEALEKVGLLSPRSNGSGYYDRFRGRVLFPILDLQSRPVGLGGRVLPEFADAKSAKYINSPETALFNKSHLLYGLDAARSAIQHTGSAVVVEGYTDCTMAHQFGVEQVVAVLGTALTERHLALLRRFTDRVILVLDGDEAGQRRANDLLELFVAQQMDLRVLTLPDGMDPCDYLLQYGADRFRESLQSAPDALEHKFRKSTEHLDPKQDTYEVTAVLEELLGILAKAPRLTETTTTQQRVKEQQILTRLADHFFLNEAELRQRLVELRRSGKRRYQEESKPVEVLNPRTKQPWQEELLELLLQDAEAVKRVQLRVLPEQFSDQDLQSIYETMLHLTQAGELATMERLLMEFETPNLKRRLVDLDEQSQRKLHLDFHQRLEGLLQRLEQKQQEESRRQAQQSMKQRKLDEQIELQLLQQAIRERRASSG